MSSYLLKLKECSSISDLISTFELKLTPKQFAYIVYKLDDTNKYSSFEIPKKSGGIRIINAPHENLKYIQKEIAIILLNCVNEIRDKKPNYLTCNHSFERDKSIISNADKHKRKKFILNIDIQDFFTSIHYGRIKGLLLKDKHFLLNEKTSQILSKLATFEGTLPQGAPTSPILSSLLGNIIDIHFLKLAKKYRFTYSRYADDITISSNIEFPNSLVYWDKNIWVVGKEITNLLSKLGFRVNAKKTRLIKKNNRQSVTGVIVNKARNSCIQYRKINRAMVHSLLSTGSFNIKNLSGEIIEGNINQLIGRLNHCIYVKYYDPKFPVSMTNHERADLRKEKREALTKIISDNWDRKKSPDIYSDHQMLLLRSVLYFKYFVAIKNTTIIPEGHTDPMYFKSALSSLKINDPLTIQKINNSLKKIGLYGATSFINSFLVRVAEKKEGFISYKNIKQKAKYPVIFVLDYDDGLDDCGYILKKFNNNENFSHIIENIYVLLLKRKNRNAHKDKKSQVCIENLIYYNSHKIRVVQDNHELVEFEGRKIRKYNFARYVSDHQEKFDFSNFRELFNTIKEIEKDYKTKETL